MVVNRFRDADLGPDPGAALDAARSVLAGRPGYLEGSIGRNLDDPGLWLLFTRWRDVGSYRRALSATEVKMGAVPVLSRALDEPSAFEDGDGELNLAVPRDLG